MGTSNVIQLSDELRNLHKLADPVRQRELQELHEERQANIRRQCDMTLCGAGIPLVHASSAFPNYYPQTASQREALKYVSSYAERFKEICAAGLNLVITGPKGTGKSHLVCALAGSLLARGYAPAFKTEGELLGQIRGTYNSGSKVTEEDVVKAAVSADLLIVDDVGKYNSKDRGYRDAQWFRFINGRYNDMLPTVVTSNLSQADLRGHLGEAVWSRLAETSKSALLPVDGDDYRLRKS